MGKLKENFLAKIENNNKKTLENLVVFGIILIATIIFINYIWNGNTKNTKKVNSSTAVAEQTTMPTNDIEQNNTLEKQIEDILNNLEGVESVKVLITYSETNKVIPMYNEDSQQSTTKEEDTQGRSKNYK
jgi:stage III sporulation protein AG